MQSQSTPATQQEAAYVSSQKLVQQLMEENGQLRSEVSELKSQLEQAVKKGPV
jgi:regulator of replication initiation timing